MRTYAINIQINARVWLRKRRHTHTHKRTTCNQRSLQTTLNYSISKPTDDKSLFVCATTHRFPTKSRTLGELHVMWPNAALRLILPIDKTTIVLAPAATDLVMTWCDFLRACLSARVWQGRANMLQAMGNQLLNVALYTFQQFLSWTVNPWMCFSNVPPLPRLHSRQYRVPRSTTIKQNS